MDSLGPWVLEDDVLHLNHGSFGAATASVLEAQQRLRSRIEANPTKYFQRRVPAPAQPGTASSPTSTPPRRPRPDPPRTCSTLWTVPPLGRHATTASALCGCSVPASATTV